MKILLEKDQLIGYVRNTNVIIFVLALAKIAFHLLHPEYGYFRDELYYIAIGDNYSFSNIDMLPLSPLYLNLFTSIFGYSIKTVHLASSLCGAFVLIISCLITKELGGKNYAVLLTGLFVLLSGFVIFGALFTYDSLDFLISAVAIYLLVKLLKYNNQKLWIIIGVVLGIGLLNKLSILFLGFAIFLSLWFVPQRESFKVKWIWIGGIIALLFLIPFIIWQSQNSWYFLDFAANYAGGIAYDASFLEYVWNQILPNNIFLLPVWLTGLWMLLFNKNWKKYRLFGIMYLILFFLYYLLGVKFYFLMPMYIILLSVGTIKIEDTFIKSSKKLFKLARFALPIIFIMLSIPLLIMLVPILPIDQLVKYASVLGVDAGVRTERTEASILPHHIADRFGWEEMVEQLADVYNNASSKLDKEIGIFTENYGQASAIHLFGKQYSLPEPISLMGWYYFQTLQNHDFKENYITIGLSESEMKKFFENVSIKGIFRNEYCLPHENNNLILLCRSPKFSLSSYWRIERNMDPHFSEIIRKEGVAAAVNYFYQLKEKDPPRLLFTERQMNSLGYEYLYNNKVKDAIALFKLNIEVYPASSNVYDSLGEAFMENKQYELAVTNYSKSLELNPKNSNAEKRLKILRELKSN